MKTINLLFCLLVSTPSLFAQYDDVAVIINDSSQASIDIGNYFQQQRNIPSQNIIHIGTPLNEEIDSFTFENIRLQIETYILANNLKDSINYLVTTKGVPLKVLTNDCMFLNTSPADISCSSFDSELSLILSPYSSNILQKSGVANPYYNENRHFTKDSFGIYLVTRLDGYTKADVFSLIDKSGPDIYVDSTIVKGVFDMSSITDQTWSNFILADLHTAMVPVWSNNIDTIFHPDSATLTDQNDVIFYHRAHYNASTSTLNFSYADGAIGTLLATRSGWTFSNSGTNTLQVADLVAEGITGGHGYAYGLFLSHPAHIEESILFDKYIRGQNLAESFYAANNFLSWQDVIIGDPKTSIRFDFASYISRTNLAREMIDLYPNPSNGAVQIKSNVQIWALEVFNLEGKLVYRKVANPGSSIEKIELNELAPGMYTVKLKTKENSFIKKLSITK